MKAVRFIALLLMVVGALNWGLVGLFQYDLVADLFGGMASMAARVVYALVGLAGLYGIGMLCSCCCRSGCGSGGCSRCGGHCGSNCHCNCHKEQ
ncbi:MAG: hypothetical protein RL235_1188 [Chlamydiota bacterium]|jgi:uncharacterized membrane protein YuzA (DUF378 family)